MSEHVHTAESTLEPMTSDQPRETAPSAPRSWAWGRTHEPYDWMDAHTPSSDLDSWR
jgi:hypothetical protein